jgi:hypothetical protein
MGNDIIKPDIGNTWEEMFQAKLQEILDMNSLFTIDNDFYSEKDDENLLKDLSLGGISTRFGTMKHLPITNEEKVFSSNKTKLLSMVSELYKLDMINDQERGILKELILDENDTLLNELDNYEVDRNLVRFYESIKTLINA